MKSLIAAALIAVSGLAQASGFEVEAWEMGQMTDKDKMKHAAVSAVLGVAAGIAIEDRKLAFAAALTPGLLKEIADGLGTKTCRDCGFSVKDMAANAVGAFIGVQAGHGIKVTIKRNGFLIRKDF